MNFKLNFEIQPSDFSIQHGDGIIFLGSCFSDEIALKAKNSGMKVALNPFGTVFHPTLLSRFIRESIVGVEQERVFLRNDIYLSWDANSTVFNFSKEELNVKLKALRNDFVSNLKISKVVYITFGTAWGYRLIKNDQLVANCHKLPSVKFEKELSEINVLYSEWIQTIKLIKSVNPTIEIVFTVSPVRHIRDGLIENNQSKAILIELVRMLTLDFENHYFPSYEIVIDELRDYRFYKLDRIHPSEEAIEYVWKSFEKMYFDEKTILLNQKVSNFRKSLSHRSIHNGSKEDINHKRNIQKQLNEFLEQNTEIIF